ncbi:MAG: hypothetical protein CSYNP_00991 [Syntrophus sp. SKADARSKE-3]|nr:hypothetical protein [Syntrophus sp. SKADARSKE-3]
MDSKANLSGAQSIGAPPSGPPPGGAPPAKGGSGAGSSADSADEVYDSSDTNKDGVVSLQELLAAEDEESLKTGIQDLLKTLAVNAQSYNEQGDGVIDVAGGVVDTVV